MNPLDEKIDQLIHQLFVDQAGNGSWNYPFEAGLATDCYMIILLRTLELNEEELIQHLVNRIVSRQEENGAWKLFRDEKEGNLTATLEAYYALLSSGYLDQHDLKMKKAKQFILAKGGITKVHMFAKVMLAITGQYEWPSFPVPIIALLLPQSFPINFFDLSLPGRANLVPILILADTKFSKKPYPTPDLSDLYLDRDDRLLPESLWKDLKEAYHAFLSNVHQGFQTLKDLPEELHSTALNRAKQYMLERIEPDGTFYNYFSSTFLMIFALLALETPQQSPLITRSIEGLKSMICDINGYWHCPYTTATVWNTTLISYALQEAGIPRFAEPIQKANAYLLSRQQYKYGDWVIHNPHALPGGWGFSDSNTINPDVDDTTAALRAIRTSAIEDDVFQAAWDRGVNWVLSMQNDDGGWPAFERHVDKKILNLLPIEGGNDLLLDPSTVDLTGRTIEFLGNYTQLDKKEPFLKKGVDWLTHHQKEDGSWRGRWGAYIYGTWAALSGLLAVDVSLKHPSIQRGITWLYSIQNPDGGWGESCQSDIQNHYVPLKSSTCPHTAWALDALILAEEQVTPEIKQGIAFLTYHEEKDWIASYPNGSGMAGAVYMNYHCYDYVWPLLTLAHYKKKFINQ